MTTYPMYDGVDGRVSCDKQRMRKVAQRGSTSLRRVRGASRRLRGACRSGVGGEVGTSRREGCSCSWAWREVRGTRSREVMKGVKSVMGRVGWTEKARSGVATTIKKGNSVSTGRPLSRDHVREPPNTFPALSSACMHAPSALGKVGSSASVSMQSTYFRASALRLLWALQGSLNFFIERWAGFVGLGGCS